MKLDGAVNTDGNGQTPDVLRDRRLSILSGSEVEAIYGRPRFTDEERVQYFSLIGAEYETLQSLRSVKSMAHFILQLGYFKAKHMFFVFGFNDIEADLEHVFSRHMPATCRRPRASVDKKTRLKQQRLILALTGYRTCGSADRRHLAAKARQAARLCSKPVYVFRELMQYMEEKRVVAPRYTTMQEVVGRALKDEQDRLLKLVQSNLRASDIRALERLLKDTSGLHEISQIRREPKNFSVSEITREITRGEHIRALYQLTDNLIPKLDISNESIKHYASLVNYYSAYKLKRMNSCVAYLYLLCFVRHRFQRLHDNIIGSLLYDVRRYNDDAKRAAKNRLHDCRLEGNQNLEKAGQVLSLFTDDDIPSDTAFCDVQSRAFSILERDKLATVAEHITTKAKFDETGFRWDHVDRLAMKFKRHLRPILLAVDFSTSSASDSLKEALDIIRDVFRSGRSLTQCQANTLPTGFIPEEARDYLYDRAGNDVSPRLLADRYEFLAYDMLRRGLEAGEIFCRDSVRFRSFDDDLIDKRLLNDRREQLISDSGLKLLSQPIETHLAHLEQQLEDKIADVNQRIASGANSHLKQVKTQPASQKRWTLQYPDDDETINHSLFDSVRQVDINSVLHFVNDRCQFVDAFEHVVHRYTKKPPNNRSLIACLIAWATNMGLGGMAASSDIGHAELVATSDSFIRPETLKEANDKVSNAIAELPIFRDYNIDGLLHSSSDGQKFETSVHTINARHSPKYFGLKKGVVSYSMVVNHVPVNATIIGANEHESQYVFDIIANNTSDIDPDRHSTDTHGSNHVNFGILHQFGYEFAPRYKNIFRKVTTSLCGFATTSHYKEGVIKPIRKINKELIIEEWPNIERILVSLAQKTTTQSIIIGKLSSYANKNRTKRALWEYDSIIQSLYLLDFVDSPALRQSVQKALNRGESYHKLRRAVSYANFGKLRFKTEQEQHIWGECSRLVTNCIIYYNACILSQLAAKTDRVGNGDAIKLIKDVSPVAWQHINLHGRYRFDELPVAIDVAKIVDVLFRAQKTTGAAGIASTP